MTTTPDQHSENSSSDDLQSSEARDEQIPETPVVPGPASNVPLAPPVVQPQANPVAPPVADAPAAPVVPAVPAPAAPVVPPADRPVTPPVDRPAVTAVTPAVTPPVMPAGSLPERPNPFAPLPSAAQEQAAPVVQPPVPPTSPTAQPVQPMQPPAPPAAQTFSPTSDLPHSAHNNTAPAPADTSVPHAPASTPQHGYVGYTAPQPHMDAAAAEQRTVEYPAFQQATTQETPPVAAPTKNRAGVLLVGLAIGALLGGVVGGGVAAVVSANMTQAANSEGGGTLTLKNPDSATTVSGVAAVATPSVVTLDVTGVSASGSGSGVIYREDGYIITNAHVVTLDGAAGNSAAIRVKLSDGRIFSGKVVGVDPYADLAVVKVEADSLPAIKVADSADLNVGDTTVAIGAPLNLANTVTSGVVSAVNRGISVGSPLIPQDPSDQKQNDGGDQGNQDGNGTFPWDFRFGNPDNGQSDEAQQKQAAGTVTLPVIQTDASINPGNSGGALLDADGKLIGINVAIASTSSSSDTAGSVGLGFAIPSNLAVRVADALIDGKQPSHGLLGASVDDSSRDTDADQNFAGGLIVKVVSQGAAEKAGLKVGDVITKVDGIRAIDGTSVSALVRMHGGGSKVTIDYMRNGKAAKTEATLGTLEW